MQRWEEKKGCPLAFVIRQRSLSERESERKSKGFLNALEKAKCERRKEKRKVKIETREWCGREKKRKKEKKERVDKK